MTELFGIFKNSNDKMIAVGESEDDAWAAVYIFLLGLCAMGNAPHTPKAIEDTAKQECYVAKFYFDKVDDQLTQH